MPVTVYIPTPFRRATNDRDRVELQATTAVPEWGGQKVRMAQEEDAVIGADGRIRWALKRQDKLFLIK